MGLSLFMLDEFVTGLRTAQAAQHAELAVMDIGNSGAVVAPRRPGVERDNIGEKNTGERGI